MYVSELYCMPRCGTPPTSICTPCRQVNAPPAELAGHYPGPVGPEYSARLSDRADIQTMASVSTYSPSLVNRATATDQQRSCRNGSERGCRANTPIRRVLFQPISSPQEGWGSKACHKPQGPEPVCSETTLQDGRDSQPEGSAAAWGLAGQSRSKGCLLYNTHPHSSQAIPPVHVPRENLSIHMSPLWAKLSPVGIHQNTETCSSSITTERSEADSIHGRHTSTRGVERNAGRSPHRNSASSGKPEFYNKPKEICPHTNTVHRVPRAHSRFPSNGATITPHKNETNTSGGLKTSTNKNNISSCTSTPTGHDERNKQRHTPSPPLLSRVANDSLKYLGETLPEL